MEVKLGNPDWTYAKCDVCGLWVWGRSEVTPHMCALCRHCGLQRGDVPYQEDGMPLKSMEDCDG